MSSNKEDIRAICERISSLVKYFKFAVTDGDPLTSAHSNTINALSEYVLVHFSYAHPLSIIPFRDITKLNEAIEEVVAERKSRLRRYVSAKQHRKKLEGVARKLDEARGNYTVSQFKRMPLQPDDADLVSTIGRCSYAERDVNRGRSRSCPSLHGSHGH